MYICSMYAMRLRWKGVAVGKGCIITGMPEVYKKKDSQIIVGNKVFMHSMRKFSPLLQHPVSLITQLPGACIELKDRCAVGGCIIEACSKISIGEYTIVGPGTVIYDGSEHDYDPEIGWLGRREKTGKPITIGQRCFIGMNCIILKGVTIGDDCVISAGSVITEDVPSGHIVKAAQPAATLLPEHLRHH